MSSHLFGGDSLVHQSANLIFLDPWTLDPSKIRSIPCFFIGSSVKICGKHLDIAKGNSSSKRYMFSSFQSLEITDVPTPFNSLSRKLEVTSINSKSQKIAVRNMLYIMRIYDNFSVFCIDIRYMFFDLPKSPNYPYSVILP